MALTVYGSPYVDGTDLVANWPAASLTVAQGIDAAGYYIGRGNNTQTGSYSTVITDAGKVITMSNVSATTVTIPANSSVAYVVGTRINILNLGAGACTPTAGAGVTINGTITALATNSSAAVIKTATNTWSYVPFGSGTPTLTSGDVSSTTGSPTITTSGGNTIYKFTGSGTIVLGKAGLATALVVGGGGGGGFRGGGAGAGGMLVGTSVYLNSGTNTVTIGAGGSAGTPSVTPNNGISSVIGQYYGVAGGAGGVGNPGAGLNGGSGGGAGADGTGVNKSGGAGVSGLGSNGGGNVSLDFGAGGGGAGAVGANCSAGQAGAGGNGLADSITGSSVTYAGGGGGGIDDTGGTVGAGGTGGGGAGGAVGVAGGVNLGGGGGGGSYAAGVGVGGAGGSGVVIISVTT